MLPYLGKPADIHQKTDGMCSGHTRKKGTPKYPRPMTMNRNSFLGHRSRNARSSPAQAPLKPLLKPFGEGGRTFKKCWSAKSLHFRAPQALLDEAEPKRCVSAASCCCPDNDVLFRSCSAMFCSLQFVVVQDRC